MQPRKRLGVSAIIVSAFGFCIYPILGKYVFAGGASLPTVLFVRFGSAAIVFWAMYLWKNGRPRLRVKAWLILLAMGGLGYAGMAGLYLWSVRFIPASLASLVFYSFPLLVTIISILTHQEVLSLKKILGLVSSCLGLLFVLGINFEVANLMGLLIAFSAASVHSVNIIAGNRILKTLSPLLSTAIITSGAALTYGLIELSSGFTWELSLATWMGIAGISLFSTIIAMLAFYKGMQLVGASTASILSMLEPVMTSVLAYLFLAERLTYVQGVGGSLVILGGIIVARIPVSEKVVPEYIIKQF
ncbi:MAG: putative permease, superfamily [Firmicutes bacterium]|nr:putative permease, superfamily [Bacillota bacterium]